MKKFLSIIIVGVFICNLFVSSAMALDIGQNEVWDPEHKVVYEDVDVDWYKEAKDFVLKETLMTRIKVRDDHTMQGSVWLTTYRNFFGEKTITRAEVAAIMSRYDWCKDSLDIYTYKRSTCQAFADVPDGKWMTPAVQWAADNGIVDGVGGDSFAPNRTITREEFATIMYRYTEFKNVERDISADISSYPDGGEVSAWAKDAMAWAVGEGLISGKPGGLLAPQDTITRAEVALIVYRYNNNVLPHRDNKK